MIQFRAMLLADVADQFAAKGHVHELVAAADAQDGLFLAEDFLDQNELAQIAPAAIRGLADGLEDFRGQVFIVEIGADVVAAGEQNAIGAAHGFGQQCAVHGGGGHERNAAGIQQGVFITLREAERKVAEFHPALFHARGNHDDRRFGHARI